MMFVIFVDFEVLLIVWCPRKQRKIVYPRGSWSSTEKMLGETIRKDLALTVILNIIELNDVIELDEAN